MSLLNDASLVMIPSGYKDTKLYSVKPTNGDGDFTFSRGSNLAATRVNSDGVLEKGRENLYTYSQQIDNAVWSKARGSVTANAIAAPDGTTTADLFTENTATGTHDIRQSYTSTSGGVYTFSIYAKANGRTRLDVYVAGPNTTGNFDLSSGSVIGGSSIDVKIEDAGSGWYRCSVCVQAVSTSTNAIWILNNGTTQNYTGDGVSGMYFWGAQAELGLVATDYIETTTTTAQAGILEDMPRLDYSGGASCPSLLLEPQRSNLCIQSEYAGSWSTDAAGTITDNAEISPEGVQNAFTLNDTSDSAYYKIERNFTATAGDHTFSVFIKKTTGALSHYAGVQLDTSRKYVIIDTTNGTWNEVGSNDNDFVDIENFSADYWRLIIRNDLAAASIRMALWPALSENGTSLSVGATGENTFYGVQVEAGSYPTSYIPTYGASSTRSQDVCSKTGISSLIGQSEGTIFIQVNSNEHISELSDGTSANRIVFYVDGSDYLRNLIRASASTSSNIQTNTTIQAGDKIALAYANNDSVIYKNGVQIGSDTSVTIPATSKVNVGSDYNESSSTTNSVNQFILFSTRLSNDELASLTTI